MYLRGFQTGMGSNFKSHNNLLGREFLYDWLQQIFRLNKDSKEDQRQVQNGSYMTIKIYLLNYRRISQLCQHFPLGKKRSTVSHGNVKNQNCTANGVVICSNVLQTRAVVAVLVLALAVAVVAAVSGTKKLNLENGWKTALHSTGFSKKEVQAVIQVLVWLHANVIGFSIIKQITELTFQETILQKVPNSHSKP